MGKREGLQGEEADGHKPHLEEGVGPVTHWRNCKQVRTTGGSAQRWGREVRGWTGSQALRVALKGWDFSSNRTTVGLKKEVVNRSDIGKVSL